MPPTSPTPARRRFTFKRLLLALVLGLAAWWGVGWWLSTRALWTLRFEDKGVAENYSNEQGDQGIGFFFDFISGDRIALIRPNVPCLSNCTLQYIYAGTVSVLRSTVFKPSEFETIASEYRDASQKSVR